MFYNVPARRNAMKGPGEEYGKLLPVVQAYAIDNPTCAVSCRKGIDGQADLATGGKAEGSSSEVVRMVYGRALAKELIEVSGEESSLGLKVNGLVTNANHSSKRLTFLLFINKRLVESVSLRKAVEEVYAAYLPKGGHPFVYLSLRLPPNALDVNVHPTKREVHFLDAEKVVASVQGLVKEKLIGANASRTFLAQAVLPGMVNGARDGTGSAEKDADASGSGDAAARPRPTTTRVGVAHAAAVVAAAAAEAEAAAAAAALSRPSLRMTLVSSCVLAVEAWPRVSSTSTLRGRQIGRAPHALRRPQQRRRQRLASAVETTSRPLRRQALTTRRRTGQQEPQQSFPLRRARRRRTTTQARLPLWWCLSGVAARSVSSNAPALPLAPASVDGRPASSRASIIYSAV